MEIKSVENYTYQDIEIEIDGYVYYFRRYPSGCWERLYGSSWECCYSEEENLEQLFHDYMKKSA